MFRVQSLIKSHNRFYAGGNMRRPDSFSFGVFTDAHITAVDGVSDSPFNVNSYSNTRYQSAIKMMNSLGLDFALNLGDMVHPLPQSPEYITAAKRYFELSSQLNCVHYNIPGNQDIGDKPSKWVPAAEISSSGMEIYKSQFGDDHQAFYYKGWRFILLNAELFNSNLAENQNQKDWFVQELKKIENGRAFVALHYPPFLYSPDEFDHYDNLGNPDREWFLKKINDYLDKVSVKIEGDMLESVSSISCNNDEELGKIIAEAYTKVGKDGVVLMEESPTEETYVEVVDGVQIDSGLTSPHFVTDKDKQAAELENPLVLIVMSEIPNIRKIQPILEYVIKNKKELLIVAQVDQQLKSALMMNKVKGNIKVNIIDLPGFGPTKPVSYTHLTLPTNREV